MTVLEDVKEVIANVIEVDSDFIQPEQMLINDLRVDSLNMFFIYTNLEKKFNIEIPDFSNRNISVLYLCRCVEKAIAEKNIEKKEKDSMFIPLDEYERMLKELKEKTLRKTENK